MEYPIASKAKKTLGVRLRARRFLRLRVPVNSAATRRAHALANAPSTRCERAPSTRRALVHGVLTRIVLGSTTRTPRPGRPRTHGDHRARCGSCLGLAQRRARDAPRAPTTAPPPHLGPCPQPMRVARASSAGRPHSPRAPPVAVPPAARGGRAPTRPRPTLPPAAAPASLHAPPRRCCAAAAALGLRRPGAPGPPGGVAGPRPARPTTRARKGAPRPPALARAGPSGIGFAPTRAPQLAVSNSRSSLPCRPARASESSILRRTLCRARNSRTLTRLWLVRSS